ncbi:vitronectin isoform X1 [Oryzias latipes]|uniref:Vitronectin a n=1 Tax=Oryzias latipes TaxID=8090 RepID=H2LVM0_ORYLA|nr:vitronectin isoform X1 [Oryzias latipes]
MKLWDVLLPALLIGAFAEDESCLDRCENGFDSQRKCQCDSMCTYYKSCCFDFEAICGMMTRGDTFDFAEDEDYVFESTTPAAERPSEKQPFTVPSRERKPSRWPHSDSNHSPHQRPEATLHMTRSSRLINEKVTRSPNTDNVAITTKAPGTNATTETSTVPSKTATTQAPDPDAEVCSGRPFDSFMQLKNGSIYAFRGEYFFELNQRSVLPGYPKLIKDVWGISGPIDAAFTRINCQGKTYIFKGNKYWRFDNGVLDDDYPRDISVGFDKIPDHVDAAFALPAPHHHGKEKVYFFKGDQYYMYEFLHQPSHEECAIISEHSPSTLFRRYTDMYYNNFERYFSELFSDLPQHHDKHHFINKDWKGLKSPVDAAMAGRIYVTPRGLIPRRYNYQPDQQWGRQQGQQWGRQYQQNGWQWGRRRSNRSPNWGSMSERGINMGQGFAERGMELGLRLAERRMEMEERFGRDWDRRWDQDWDQDRRRDVYNQNNRGNYDSRDDRFFRTDMPIQNVYFFKGDKYFRVDLSTKRVDPAMPPYPRSIAKYWLGCSDTPELERK